MELVRQVGAVGRDTRELQETVRYNYHDDDAGGDGEDGNADYAYDHGGCAGKLRGCSKYPIVISGWRRQRSEN